VRPAELKVTRGGPACTGPADTCSFDDQCEENQNICDPSPDVWHCIHVEGCL
jgi:hypothetical protein